jgi:hypothetical protein
MFSEAVLAASLAAPKVCSTAPPGHALGLGLGVAHQIARRILRLARQFLGAALELFFVHLWSPCYRSVRCGNWPHIAQVKVQQAAEVPKRSVRYQAAIACHSPLAAVRTSAR